MSARSYRRAREREIKLRTKRERAVGTRSKAAVAVGAGLGATVLFAPAADAATFTVSNLNDNGAGSLREAIDDANAAGGADQVAFASGLSGTITLTTGELPINEDLDIVGPGASVITVSGDDSNRVFYLGGFAGNDGSVSISGLTLVDGSDIDGGTLYSGNSGADATLDGVVITGSDGVDGGAIYVLDHSLTVRNSTIASGYASADGGAISFYDSAGDINETLTIANTTISGNESFDEGGGVYVAAGVVNVQNSTFDDNESLDDSAGGLFHQYGPLTITDSSFARNTASSYGGAINTLDTDDFDARIERSTFTGNTAEFGGAIYVEDPAVDTTIADSTFSGNTAAYGGGAMWLDSNAAEADTTVLNSTITGNSAYYAGGIFFEYDDGTAGGSVAISSSILANNTRDPNSSYLNADLGQDDESGTISAGFSLIESGGGVLDDGTNDLTLVENPAGSNLFGVDPQLGPLQNNGGPTLTHAPALTSPVLDGGVGNGLATDQRGAPRTFDAANFANAAGGDGTDIGSVELLPGGRLSLASCKGATENLLFAPGTAIVGTDANDVIVGTDANDSINSGKGKDKVCAGAGNDGVKAGSGKDNVAGQAGKDRIKGNGGNDKLQGNAGKDTLKGGGGKDTLKGGGGKDKLRGGPGRDKLKGGGGKDSEVQ